MRLLTFDDDRLGVATAGGVVDVTDLAGGMVALIEGWPKLAGAVSEAAASAPRSTATRSSCGRRSVPRRSLPRR